jgi:hypothetical protein
MKDFELTLSKYPENCEGNKLRAHANGLLGEEVAKVLAGNNEEVERRYRYYVDYS